MHGEVVPRRLEGGHSSVSRFRRWKGGGRPPSGCGCAASTHRFGDFADLDDRGIAQRSAGPERYGCNLLSEAWIVQTRWRVSQRQRLTLLAAILGSAVASIDGSIVNVALPAIERDLGGGLSAQQWVSNAYLLALGSLILIGGSLGDIYGERRIFTLGLAGFGVFSIACALAPTIEVADRGARFQGVAAALLTPSSLAIIVSAFGPKERGAAIGSWTAWGGIAAIVGPLAGGWIVDQLSWRWIFALNVPLVIGTLILVLAVVPATSGRRPARSISSVPVSARSGSAESYSR